MYISWPEIAVRVEQFGFMNETALIYEINAKDSSTNHANNGSEKIGEMQIYGNAQKTILLMYIYIYVTLCIHVYGNTIYWFIAIQ